MYLLARKHEGTFRGDGHALYLDLGGGYKRYKHSGGNHEATPLRFDHDYVSIKMKGRKKKTQQGEHPIPHEAQRFHFVALTKYSIITKKGPLGYCGSYPHGAISSEV